MSRLLLYHDFVSPYCRLALGATLEAASRAGLEVRPVPFELHPAPADLPAPDGPELAGQLETASAIAREWGTELGTLSTVPRTRKAHEAVAHARTRGGAGVAELVLRGIYRALWLDGRDIARLDVLSDVGEAAGLEREPLHVALGLNEFEAEVVAEQDAAAAAGITGVPAVQLGGVLATGLLSEDELFSWMDRNR
jgi:predicted DsbA family dithiol-disulfide isomerase